VNGSAAALVPELTVLGCGAGTAVLLGIGLAVGLRLGLGVGVGVGVTASPATPDAGVQLRPALVSRHPCEHVRPALVNTQSDAVPRQLSPALVMPQDAPPKH
jgi:hypothetical protein